jgi:hypothetical protein
MPLAQPCVPDRAALGTAIIRQPGDRRVPGVRSATTAPVATPRPRPSGEAHQKLLAATPAAAAKRANPRGWPAAADCHVAGSWLMGAPGGRSGNFASGVAPGSPHDAHRIRGTAGGGSTPVQPEFEGNKKKTRTALLLIALRELQAETSSVSRAYETSLRKP